MVVLITCKNEEDSIKHEGARVLTTLYIEFSDAMPRAGNFIVNGLICFKNSNSSKFLCMPSFPARMKKFLSKMKALEWSQHFSHCKFMGIFSNAQGQLTPQSMVGSGRIRTHPRLYSCPSYLLNEEDPIKMKVLEC